MTRQYMITTFLLLGSAGTTAHAQSTISSLGQQLQGSWLGTLTVPGQPPTKVISTYLADGSLVAQSSSNPGAQIGSWIRTGDRQFLSTIITFRYDDKGAFIGLLKIRVVDILGETLDVGTGTAEADVLLPDGTVIASISGITFTQKRIAVETMKNTSSAPATAQSR